MTESRTSSVLRGQTALAACLTVALSACGGGGSDSGGGGSFALVETNVFTSQSWAINRAMTFQFTQPVDLNSVNLNTISVAQIGGAPAVGTFSLLDPYTVSFQPNCPTQDSFTDAGLQPGGLIYRVDLVSSTTGGVTVRSMRGDSLSVGLTTQIVTPDATDLAELFDDTQIGPPAPLIWDGTGTMPQSGVSYLEEGGSADSRFILERRDDSSASALGAQVALDGYTAPLNLYSDTASTLSIVVLVDQPVDPSASNVNSANVRLEYCSRLDGNCGPGEWINLPNTVELESNCANGGAVLRVTPIGILPLARLVRVSFASAFRDLVGNGNLLELPVVSFFVRDGIDPDTMQPIVFQDEFLEPFQIVGTDPASGEDTNALLDAPLAEWGEDGTLRASFEFGGTGGPGPNGFDWVVPMLPGNNPTVLNTIFSTIPNAEQSLTQTVVNGQVDVHDFTVEEGGILDIRGPNACVIRATGTVTINGKIRLRGVNNVGLTTLDSGNLSETGATGNAGGGQGGTGNVLTTQSSPAGGAGFGAFGQIGGGGGGGDSAFSLAGVNQRRGAGGGGGVLGPPMILFTPTPVVPLGGGAAVYNVNGCPDQRILGLDAEEGNPGALNAGSAILGPGQRPRGGVKGPGPFLDSNPDNNFFGLIRRDGTIIRGELDRAWAGAGGGGGGNAIPAASFPHPMWTFATDEKGAGGGGGGGSLTILCLGSVVFGPNGRIDANGGAGGGGENTANFNRIGGGSGGGSGGHVIIQVGQEIDFRFVRTNQQFERDRGGIWTRGGQGGGQNEGLGGTNNDGNESTPQADRLPRDHYTLAQGGLATPAPCAVAAAGNLVAGANPEGVAGCGGDGGPGIIQLHAPLLTSIRIPVAPSTETLTNMLKPNPVGSTITFGNGAPANTSDVNNPAEWDQLLPGFGRLSKSQSKWIALGSTSVSPVSTSPETTEFRFGGVDASGLVQKSGMGAGATQLELPSILTGSGTQTIVAAPSTPFITADKRTVVFDGTTLNDEIYLRNPALLRFFDVRFVTGVTVRHFEAVSATYEESTGLLRLTVGTSGLPLSAIPTDGSATVSLRPRFFRVRTAGTSGLLPDPATIQFEFQAAPINATTGQPNTGAATPWTTNIEDLNTSPNNTSFRFFRFRVTFDLGAGELSENTPVPAVEFLRVPFRF